MNELMSGYKFKVVEINDKHLDYVVIALYESITDAKGYEIRSELVDCKITESNSCHEDVALSIYYDKRRYTA